MGIAAVSINCCKVALGLSLHEGPVQFLNFRKILSTCIFNTFLGLGLQLNASASRDQAKINQKQEQEVHFNVIFIY